MRERVELVGGTFSLTSAPRQGTRIAVTVPV
jgi:signal transduction histidine kinase